MGVVVALAASTGCTAVKGLDQREAVVVFKGDATDADRARVHGECGDIPGTQVQPMPTTTKKSSQLYGVRFRVDGANDRQLNDLFLCLQKDPSVEGVKIPEKQ